MSVVDQAIVFSLVISWGCIVGLIFDCYRTLRKIWRPGHLGTSLGDIIFWLLITVFTYLFLMIISWGEVRFYVFLAIGLGLGLYLKIFSRTVRKYLLKLYYLIIKLCSYLIKVFTVPIMVLKKVLHVPFGYIKRILKYLKPRPKPPDDPPNNF